MAPTLPTELIKRILEFVYDDVRAAEGAATPPYPSSLDGAAVCRFLQPFLLVSREVYQLALPIAVRHIVCNRGRQMPHAVVEEGYGSAVRSVAALEGAADHELGNLFRQVTKLDQLYLEFLPSLSLTLQHLPPTVTRLTLAGLKIGGELWALIALLPEVHDFTLISVICDNPPPALSWTLSRLCLQMSGSKTTGVGSSGVEEEALDFDAEDDEMWARQWSEAKREAMGLVAEFEEEEGQSTAPGPAFNEPSAMASGSTTDTVIPSPTSAEK